MLLDMGHTEIGKQRLEHLVSSLRTTCSRYTLHPLKEGQFNRVWDRSKYCKLLEISDDRLKRYIKHEELRTNKLTCAENYVIIGDAVLSREIPPDKFWYDFAFQYLREDISEITDKCRNKLLYTLLLNGELPKFKKLKDLEWTKPDFQSVFENKVPKTLQILAWIHGSRYLNIKNVVKSDTSKSKKILLDLIIARMPLKKLNNAKKTLAYLRNEESDDKK
eukprot:UN28735